MSNVSTACVASAVVSTLTSYKVFSVAAVTCTKIASVCALNPDEVLGVYTTFKASAEVDAVLASALATSAAVLVTFPVFALMLKFPLSAPVSVKTPRLSCLKISLKVVLKTDVSISSTEAVVTPIVTPMSVSSPAASIPSAVPPVYSVATFFAKFVIFALSAVFSYPTLTLIVSAFVLPARMVAS